MKKKRGTFAARAHSFKENFLDALKHSPGGGSAAAAQHHHHRRGGGGKEFIQLAKKTSSTDNLSSGCGGSQVGAAAAAMTGHLGTARNTDCLVKEVQFALKYFQDVVAKRTHEMLPGCATVVLETLLAIQVTLLGNIRDDYWK